MLWNIILNDAKTCKYLKLSMQETSKLKASQGYYTTSMHDKLHPTKKPQNRAKITQNKNKIMLEHTQNMLG